MLTTEDIKKIEEFVYTKPRSIQEIANQIEKNWRTVDRYVKEIEKDYGTISTRVFRKGTRGALKIVYWTSMENASSSVFQKELEEKILSGRTKYDFSSFDIFQYIAENKKSSWVEKNAENTGARLPAFKSLLEKAEKQVLFFSGNLSFINYKDNKTDIFKEIEKLVKKGVSIKAVCRVDLAGKENVQKLLSLNFKYGNELIEIHHKEQPLRASIIDNKILNMKEVQEPTGKTRELEEKTLIFYTIKNKEWIDWETKIFWKMFNTSIDAKKRMDELNKIFD